MLRRNLYALAALCVAAAIFMFTKPEPGPGGTAQETQASRPASPARQASLPGFDFYVLSLSWSPTWCTEQGADAADEAQCSSGRPHGFVVHGLWPQRERGWPEFCDTAFGKRIDGAIADDMADIMPSRDLVFHQWRKHGSCSGLAPHVYFDLVRAAHEAVVMPERFDRINAHLSIGPGEIERAFIAANPGLQNNAIAVTCSQRYLREVRICMTGELAFRPCAEVDQNACRTAKTVMPPARR